MKRSKLNIIMLSLSFVLLCLIIVCLVYMDDIRVALNGSSDTMADEEFSWATLPQGTKDTLTLPAPETTVSPTFNTVETTAPTTIETTVPTTEATTVPTTEETTVPTTEGETMPVFEDIGEAAAEVARQQIGKPYEYGKAGPDSFDTSGLIFYCYKQVGLSIPRSNKGLSTFGYEVPKEEIRPGDAVFFWSKEAGVPEYPGIYIGDGMVVASMNSTKPIVEFNMNSAYFTEHFVFVRRFY